MQHEAHPIPSLLVTGSSGRIDFELRRSLAPLGDTIALDRATCNLTRPDMLRKVVRKYHPDVIVDPATYTVVDKAETGAQTAFAVNNTTAGVLTEETRALDSLLVHYSTGYVFGSTEDGTYVKTDPANPQSVYGKSKFANEEAIAQSGVTALVMRTCWMAEARDGNFARTMLKPGHERNSLRAIADQFGASATVALITDVTVQTIARARLTGDHTTFPSGVYHLAAVGETTWHGYATAVLRYAKVLGVELEIDPDYIEAISVTAYPLPAPRPVNSRVNTGKLVEISDVHLPDWQRGIHLLLDQILS